MAPSVLYLVLSRLHHHEKVVGVFTTKARAETSAEQVRCSDPLLSQNTRIAEYQGSVGGACMLVETRDHLEFRQLVSLDDPHILSDDCLSRRVELDTLLDPEYIQLMCNLVHEFEGA